MKIVSVMNLYLESIELLELGEIRHIIACEEPWYDSGGLRKVPWHKTDTLDPLL